MKNHDFKKMAVLGITAGYMAVSQLGYSQEKVEEQESILLAHSCGTTDNYDSTSPQKPQRLQRPQQPQQSQQPQTMMEEDQKQLSDQGCKSCAGRSNYRA